MNEPVSMTPRELVNELSKYIIGQQEAKRNIAIAYRNRDRRMMVDEPLRHEIMPSNLLLIGPTGVGKTELARRLAAIANVPFIKVEATKFTEVGYVGRDVESIIRDLVDAAIKKERDEALEHIEMLAAERAEERVLDLLMPKVDDEDGLTSEERKSKKKARATFRKKLRAGEFDDMDIELEVAAMPVGVEIMTPHGMEELTNQIQGMFQHLMSQRTKKRKVKVKEAMQHLPQEEAMRMLNEDEIQKNALDRVEQNGIVFIDEIDKIAHDARHRSGGEVSREGVQRDLLPLIEGCSVATKHGTVRTDHILFIASGAFQLTKPSDLVPELQGRLPIRVELSALSEDDFVKILSEPNASLTKQYTALMATEKLKLRFTKDGIRQIAKIAYQLNEHSENIGARRLQAVMARLLQQASFDAPDEPGKTLTINAKYVKSQLSEVLENDDLRDYIL